MADVQDGQGRGGGLQFEEGLEGEGGVAAEARPLIVELRAHLALGEASRHTVILGERAVERFPEASAEGRVERAHVRDGETDHRGGKGQSGRRRCGGSGCLLGPDRGQGKRHHEAQWTREGGGSVSSSCPRSCGRRGSLRAPREIGLDDLRDEPEGEIARPIEEGAARDHAMRDHGRLDECRGELGAQRLGRPTSGR